MHKDTIILITRGFPFGRGEAFLETEIDYISKSFEKVLIFSQIEFIYDGFDKKEKRDLPNNVTVFKVPTAKSKNIFHIKDTPLLLKEVFNLLLSGKFSILNLKTIFSYFIQAKNIRHCVESNISDFKLDSLTLYSYWLFAEPLANILIKQRSSCETKILSRCHGGDIYEELQSGNYLPFRKLYFSRLNRVFTVSDAGKTYLSNNYGYKQNLITSFLGVKQNSFISHKESPTIRIVSIGALYFIKRIELIIESLNVINEYHIEWNHFGAGPDEAKIHSLAEEKLKQKKNIDFHFNGFVTNEDLLKYLKSNHNDFLLSVSSSEGIPVSMMEAMSFGIPVIGTNVGGVSEIVNQENGYLISSNPTAQEIASIIETFHQLSNEDKQKKREEAYSTWKNKYNADTNYTEFENSILHL